MNQDISAKRIDGSTFNVEVQSEEPHFYGFFEINLEEEYEEASEHNSSSYDRFVNWETMEIPEQIFYEGEKELFENWVLNNKLEIENYIR